MSHILYLLINL